MCKNKSSLLILSCLLITKQVFLNLTNLIFYFLNTKNDKTKRTTKTKKKYLYLSYDYISMPEKTQKNISELEKGGANLCSIFRAEIKLKLNE